ncbi:MAG: hypothetical protein WC655_26595 [Candidatus Hydrogenedentales bacterium]|jgi:hypothetical protein
MLAACAFLGAGLELKANTLYRLDLQGSDDPVYGVYKFERSTVRGKIYNFQMVSPDPNALLSTETFPDSEISDAIPVDDETWAKIQSQAQMAAGNVEVETSAGALWVSKQEFELAQRATQMAEERLQRSKPPVVEEVPQTAPVPAAEPAPAPGFLKLWGGHLVLLGVAAVLIGAVVKFMVVGSE